MRIHIFVGVIVLTLCACASTTTPRTDEKLGETMNILKALQVINPEASRNTDPVRGVDGKSARAAMETYHEGMKKSAAPAQLESQFGGSK